MFHVQNAFLIMSILVSIVLVVCIFIFLFGGGEDKIAEYIAIITIIARVVQTDIFI